MSSATPPAPGPTRLPIDTSGIELPAGIHALMEALARRHHDVRAQRRLTVGSTRGSERNTARRYSNLLPFDALADDEKEHERQTAIETLKTIISLGYTVLPPVGREPTFTLEPAPHGPAAPPPGRLPAEQTRLDMAGIVEQWRTRDPAVWADRPDLYPLVASYLRRAGEPLLAYDVALEGLGLWPKDVLLRQLLGLVLHDLRCAQEACGVLEPLAREAHPDARALEETLGILARVYKDIALGTHDAARRRHWLRKAYRAYATAHQRTGGHWTGINAATVAMLLGLSGAARTLAGKVSRKCRADIAGRDASASIDDQYWLRATLGEAALI